MPAPTDHPDAFAMVVDGPCMEPDIERHPDYRGDRARSRGTRITVDDVVIMHRHLGQSLEEIGGR